MIAVELNVLTISASIRKLD